MAILPILTIPDKLLRRKAAPIEKVDKHIQGIMHDMLETMYDDKGIGLAANQVAILSRVLVIDLQELSDEERPEGFFPLFLANPKLIFCSEEKVSFNEGCLSVPDEVIEIMRPKTIKLEYLDYNNNLQTLESSGLLARVLQHEMDHLEGKLIIDYVSKLKKDILMKKFIKIKEQQLIENTIE
jgi:peptide deformylase